MERNFSNILTPDGDPRLVAGTAAPGGARLTVAKVYLSEPGPESGTNGRDYRSDRVRAIKRRETTDAPGVTVFRQVRDTVILTP